jgi:hypothetical protein
MSTEIYFILKHFSSLLLYPFHRQAPFYLFHPFLGVKTKYKLSPQLN